MGRRELYLPSRSKEAPVLESTEVAQIIADVAVDKKAADVVVLDIREQSVIADYFVICTGSNPRQIQEGVSKLGMSIEGL